MSEQPQSNSQNKTTNNSQQQKSKSDKPEIVIKIEQLSQIIIDLESKGLETRHGAFMNQRINYCRGKDLKRLFDQNKEHIANELNRILGVDIGPKGNHAINKFYNM